MKYFSYGFWCLHWKKTMKLEKSLSSSQRYDAKLVTFESDPLNHSQVIIVKGIRRNKEKKNFDKHIKAVNPRCVRSTPGVWGQPQVCEVNPRCVG